MEKDRARRIVAALVIAHVALHAAALWMVLSRVGRPWLFDLVLIRHALFMLGPTQGTLVALWTVFGGGKFVWRATSVTLGTFLYVYLIHTFCEIVFWTSHEELLGARIVEMCLCGTVLLLVRLAGFRLVQYPDPRQASGPFQFSIRDMLTWTTAVAVILGAWKSLPQYTFYFLEQSIPADLFFLGSTLVSSASILLALGRRWTVARIVLLPVAVLLAGMLLSGTSRSGYSLGYYIFLFALMTVWLVPSLLALRYASYRLAWRPRFEEPQENTAA